jgi:hypothetical protein
MLFESSFLLEIIHVVCSNNPIKIIVTKVHWTDLSMTPTCIVCLVSSYQFHCLARIVLICLYIPKEECDVYSNSIQVTS